MQVVLQSPMLAQKWPSQPEPPLKKSYRCVLLPCPHNRKSGWTFGRKPVFVEASCLLTIRVTAFERALVQIQGGRKRFGSEILQQAKEEQGRKRKKTMAYSSHEYPCNKLQLEVICSQYAVPSRHLYLWDTQTQGPMPSWILTQSPAATSQQPRCKIPDNFARVLFQTWCVFLWLGVSCFQDILVY